MGNECLKPAHVKFHANVTKQLLLIQIEQLQIPQTFYDLKCKMLSLIEWGNYDIKFQKSHLPWVPSRFSYGFYNVVFQFMSKIKSVVNIT